MLNRILKKILSLAVSLLIVFVYVFFIDTSPKDVGKILAQGELDLIFKGEVSKKYKDIIVDNKTQQEYDNYHKESIKIELDYFFSYFMFDENYKKEHNEELVGIFKKIYSQTKYKIVDAKEENNTVNVTFDIEPLNIMLDLEKEYSIILDDMLKEIGSDKVDYTDEKMNLEFTKRCIEKLKEKSKESPSYGTKKQLTIKVIKGNDDLYQVDEKDIMKALEELIPYQQ